MAKQFPEVNGKYGAPMGRSQYGRPDDCEPRSVRLFAVRLHDGYDDGGAYWGLNFPGAILYCATDGKDYLEFIRAENRTDAAVRMGIEPDRLIRGVRG